MRVKTLYLPAEVSCQPSPRALWPLGYAESKPLYKTLHARLTPAIERFYALCAYVAIGQRRHNARSER